MDWVGYAISGAVNAHTAGATQLSVRFARTIAEARIDKPTIILRGYLTTENNHLVARAILSNAETGSTRRRITAFGDPLIVARKIASELTPQVRPFTNNAAAAKFFGEALQSDAPAPILLKAVEADPQFGAAYLPLAQALAANRDAEGALAILRRAASLEDPITRARGAFLLAGLSRDPIQQLAASETLAKLVPAEAEPAVQTAALLHSRRQFTEAGAWYRKALIARPDSALIWNSAAYTFARSGDFPAAVDALAQYARLEPDDANALDSLGEIQFMEGKFSEAAKAFLDSYQKNPTFQRSIGLKKAAIAQRMAGDKNAADSLFNKYLDAVNQDPMVPIYRARWQYLSGDAVKAIEAVKAIAADLKSPPNVSSIAALQATVWLLHTGNRTAAAAASKSPIAVFMSQPSASSSEWALRSETQLNEPATAGAKRLALAYALLLDKQYQEASLVLREIYESNNPDAADNFRELLAWTYVELGKWDEARPLLLTWPVPSSSSDETFECLSYPKSVEIRKRLKEHR